MTTTRIYGRCSKCGSISYREPGQRHGDGQVDSDESPVWLLSVDGMDPSLPDKVDALDSMGVEIGDCTRHCCGN